MSTAIVVLSVLLFLATMTIIGLINQRNDLGATAQERADAPPDPEVHEALESSLPRLVAALDALRLGVVVADADEVLSFQNSSAEAILSSHDSRTIINRALRELLVEAVRGDAGEREIELFGPPPATYLIRAVPLTGASSGGGGVAVVEDITERRRVDQVRRDFVSNISHELKTPVGAVGLLAETLRDETDPATIHRFSERMAGEIARLSRTIDDLLELSQIEFADDLFFDSIEVADVLGEVFDRFRSAADSREITLTSAGDVHLLIRGDRRQVNSAVSNLVDNAVKYSSEGGLVTVTVSARDGVVDVAVSDEGPGIPSRDLDRIFERFYRVDRARSRETGGTGLGLAIVRHVAQNHGGDVSVVSKEGHGARFTLSLPRADDSASDDGKSTDGASDSDADDVVREVVS